MCVASEAPIVWRWDMMKAASSSRYQLKEILNYTSTVEQFGVSDQIISIVAII